MQTLWPSTIRSDVFYSVALLKSRSGPLFFASKLMMTNNNGSIVNIDNVGNKSQIRSIAIKVTS